MSSLFAGPCFVNNHLSPIKHHRHQSPTTHHISSITRQSSSCSCMTRCRKRWDGPLTATCEPASRVCEPVVAAVAARVPVWPRSNQTVNDYVRSWRQRWHFPCYATLVVPHESKHGPTHTTPHAVPVAARRVTSGHTVLSDAEPCTLCTRRGLYDDSLVS